MARTKRRPGRVTEHIQFYVKPDERRGIEAAAEANEMTMSLWIRQLIKAELSRLAAREQLAAP